LKSGLRVTIVDSDISYPPTSGKRLRTLNLLLPLAHTHDLTYIGRSSGHGDDDVAREFFSDYGISPIFIDEPIAQKGGFKFWQGLATNMVSPRPYSVDSHRTPKLQAAVAAHAASGPIDVMQLEHLCCLYAAKNQSAPIVLQAHNVEAKIWQRYCEVERSWAKRAYMGEQWRKYAHFERAAFQSVQRVVCVSESDQALAHELYGPLPTSVVDNGVDVSYFGSVTPAAASNKIVFLGALDWRPNLDAVDQLLSAIFPALRAIVPQAELIVVGRRAPAQLQQRIAATPGAQLHADVPDVRPYLADSAAMTVPLRIGGGSRLKILESLASGLPVVSTTIGAEGLALQNNRHIVIADDVAGQARALADAIQKPARSQAMAAAGRSHVAGRYAWPALAARLESVWEAVLRERLSPAAARVSAGTQEPAGPEAWRQPFEG
jgi:polysaccharide biosynthesis protein PslH